MDSKNTLFYTISASMREEVKWRLEEAGERRKLEGPQQGGPLCLSVCH